MASVPVLVSRPWKRPLSSPKNRRLLRRSKAGELRMPTLLLLKVHLDWLYLSRAMSRPPAVPK